MITIKLGREKPLNLLFVAFISCFFGSIILQYDFKAIVLLIAIVFVLIFLKKVEYAFYFILASRSVVDILYDVEASGNIKLTQFIGMSITVLFLSYLIVNGYNIFRLGVNKIYGIFLFLSIIPIFFTRSLTDGFESWLKLLQGFLVMNMTILVILLAGEESYKKRIKTICWSVLIAVALPFIIFLKSYVQGTYVIGSGDIIRYSTFGAHYNVFSYLLLFAFAYCLFLYSVNTNNSNKLLLLIIMLIMIVTIYKTYTRNVWIGLAALLICWNLVRKKFKIILFFLIFFVLMVICNSDIQKRFGDIITILNNNFFDLEPRLMSSRVGIWQSNLHYFIEKSTLLERLFGNGYDIPSKVIFVTMYLNHPIGEHNNYLTLLMNTGIFGLFTYLIYIFKLFQESFKLLKTTKDIILKNLAYVFISFLFVYLSLCTATHIIWFTTVQYYFSVFAGLVIAANILEDKKRCGTMVNNYANI